LLQRIISASSAIRAATLASYKTRASAAVRQALPMSEPPGQRCDRDVFADLMRDKARSMPTGPDDARVTALRVWHFNYLSLAAVASYPNLRTLVVATYPDADLEPIASLKSLEYLSLVHMPNICDLTPLEGLSHLRTMRLATLPSWDSRGRVTVVESLEPLALLPRLMHLELFGVRPPSKSLQDLEAALNLISVRVSKFPEAETKRFYRATGVSNAFAPSPGVADWD
jgi:hypothetical protein